MDFTKFRDDMQAHVARMLQGNPRLYSADISKDDLWTQPPRIRRGGAVEHRGQILNGKGENENDMSRM